MSPLRSILCAAGILVLALGRPAHAEQGPGLRFSAGLEVQHDNNLFRLPPGADPVALLGQSQTSDAVVVKRAGLSFDQRYSLQNVHLEVALVDYDFQRFSQYDLTAKNHGFAWDWAYTPQLQGRLFTERTETVNSFDGTNTDTDTDSGNRRVKVSQGLDLRYEIDGAWTAVGGLSHREDRSDQAQVGEDGYRQNTAEAGLRRQFGSGSQVTARLQRHEGRNLSSTLVADDSYRQTDLRLDLRWVISGLTTAEASLRHADRQHPAAPALDYSGLNATANLRWQPTGKLQWTLSASSMLDSYQSSASTHARTHKLGLRGLWAISDRTALQAGLDTSRLRLLGHPAGGATSPRRDTGTEASLTLTWKPDDLLTVDAGMQHRRRDSNLASYDFVSTQYRFGVSAAF